MTPLHRDLDAELPGAVAVAGRSVPGSADIELVVDGASEPPVTAALHRLRFERRGDVWARFHSCTADVVRVVPVHRWASGAPAGELQRMVSGGGDVPGCARLRWLGLADELLVLSLRHAQAPAPAPAAARERLHRALVGDPSAWVVAAEQAVGWRAEAAVRIARDVYDGGHVPTERERRELAAEAGPPRRSRTGVVALSGLDGSGKSTQSHALAATLAKLGHDVSVEWTRLSFDAGLDSIAAPVKAILRRGSDETDTAEDADGAVVADRHARDLRARRPLVNHAWTAIVAAANGRSQRRTTLQQLAAGRVVVRDRYVLDSVVQLHDVYGATSDVTAQALLIEKLSPRPLAAFYLRVPPDEAYRRKPEEYSPAELAAHAGLYEREAARLGVQVVDATADRAEIAALLARDVWQLVS